MMDGNMGSIMAWMMGFGLLGWVVVIGLLIAILVVLIRLAAGLGSRDQSPRASQQGGPEVKR